MRRGSGCLEQAQHTGRKQMYGRCHERKIFQTFSCFFPAKWESYMRSLDLECMVSEASAVSYACTHKHADTHTQTQSRTPSQHHCSMKHKTPVGCWPGFPAPSIQCDHVLDRRKQKLHGTVSTSDGANPNLATSDAAYSRNQTCGFLPLFLFCLQAALIKYDPMSFLSFTISLVVSLNILRLVMC